MKFLLVFLLSVAALAENPTATVTFFREDPPAAKKSSPSDEAGPNGNWNIYLDGVKLADLYSGRMVSFSVPVGHHMIKTDQSSKLDIDLRPGSHFYIRPLLDNRAPKETVQMVVVNCSLYADQAGNIKTTKPTDIFTGTQVMKDVTFEKVCPGADWDTQ